MIKQALGRILTASKTVTRMPYDCIDLLRADHMKVEALLVQLRLMRNPERRKKLFRQIRRAIDDHMALEEGLFYPAAEKLPNLRDLIDHGRTDHQLVKAVLKDLEIIKPDSRRYDSLLTKLIMKLEGHVMDEENKVFPGVRKFMDRAEFRQLNRQMLEEHKELAERPSQKAA